MFERFKTLLRHKDVLTNQFYNLCSFGATAIVGIATLKLITSKIDTHYYGYYSYTLALINLAAISTIKGYNKTIGGYIAKGYHGVFTC